jgi:hypothetical protein
VAYEDRAQVVVVELADRRRDVVALRVHSDVGVLVEVQARVALSLHVRGNTESETGNQKTEKKKRKKQRSKKGMKSDLEELLLDPGIGRAEAVWAVLRRTGALAAPLAAAATAAT